MSERRRTPLDVVCEQLGIGTSHNSGDRPFGMNHDAEPQYDGLGVADDEIIDDGDEDIVFKVRTAEPSLIGIDDCTAQCIKVEGPKEFNCWGEVRRRLIFVFKVIEPNSYAGTKLKMFAEFNPGWPYIPRAAKLYKLIQIAGGKMVVGRELRFNRMFQHKIFNCRLKQTGGRTIITTLTSKVVG
jgi:hypothetical protein